MAITLEQARALDAVAATGSISGAAKKLRKTHTAILYAIKELETETRITLVDRSGYRGKLTPSGDRVLRECRKLLLAEDELKRLCVSLSEGWEPKVKVVADGAMSASPVTRAMEELRKLEAPTEVHLFTGYHREVEEIFEKEGADLMVSVVAPKNPAYALVPLKPIEMVLVAHRDHPLAQARARLKTKRKRTLQELQEYPLLTVRGSDERLNLSTSSLAPRSEFQFGDFLTKRGALLSNLGFGWMPKKLVSLELRMEILRPVRWQGSSRHLLKPHVYRLKDREPGRAASLIMRFLREDSGPPDCHDCKEFPECRRCPYFVRPFHRT